MNGWKATVGVNGFTMVLVWQTIGTNVFWFSKLLLPMVFGLANHWYQFFLMVFGLANHLYQWLLVWQTIGTYGFLMVFGLVSIFFNGFVIGQPLDTMVFQWFHMVANHWSNDGVVTIQCHGLDSAQAHWVLH